MIFIQFRYAKLSNICRYCPQNYMFTVSDRQFWLWVDCQIIVPYHIDSEFLDRQVLANSVGLDLDPGSKKCANPSASLGHISLGKTTFEPAHEIMVLTT